MCIKTSVSPNEEALPGRVFDEVFLRLEVPVLHHRGQEPCGRHSFFLFVSIPEGFAGTVAHYG
jgi:hypothetical protein